MPLQAILFLVIFSVGNTASLVLGPLYGLGTYIYVYFNVPSHQYWSSYVPDFRWSFFSAVILVLSCIFHRDILSPHQVRKCFTYILLVLYLILVSVSAMFSPIQDSNSKIYEFGRYVIIFFLIIKIITDEKKYQTVLHIITLATFNICLLGQHRFQGGRLDSVGTVDASSANQFAGLLVIVLTLMASVIISSKRRIRVIYMLMAPIILNVFIMCGSRGAFIGLLGSGIIYVFVLIITRTMNKRIFVCCLAGFMGLTFLMGSSYLERLTGVVQGDSDSSELSAGRTDIWKAGLSMSRDYPFGAGGGSFLLLSTKYLTGSMLAQYPNGRAAHNTYLLALVEQGWQGLLVLAAFIVFTLRELGVSIKRLAFHRKLLHTDDRRLDDLLYLSTGLLAAMVSLALTSLFADRLYFEMFYWLGAFSICVSKISLARAKEFDQQ